MHGSRRAVLLVDALELRRAAIASFLGPWAAGENVRIVSCGWPRPEILDARDCAFVVHSIGAARASSPQVATALLTLRGLYPKAPMVVLCDGDHCDDVMVAADCGVNGYLDGRLSAELMPHALSFVMRGGSYIPPSAVTRLPRESGISLGRMLAATRRPAPGRHRTAELPPAFVGGLQDPRFQYYLPDDEIHLPSLVPVEPESLPNREGAAEGATGGSTKGATEGATEGATGEGAAESAPSSLPALVEHGRRLPSGGPAPPATDGPPDRMAAGMQMTERQMAVLRGLAKGDPNKVIANRLGLTETTVKVHVREIMRKLGVSNRTQVALVVGDLPPEPGGDPSASVPDKPADE